MDIGVVLVTFNRINDLKIALDRYENQIKKPKYILVVNNNSCDGTSDMLERWKRINSDINKFVINLENNIGGSGGFHIGLEKALKLDCDWIWVSDDDAYPLDDALSNAERFLEGNSEIENISAICGSVINNNKIDTSHRRRLTIGKYRIYEDEVNIDEYERDYFEVNLFSYVGSIINKKYLQLAGTTERDYFIYCDDTEHSYRLSKLGKIFCVPQIKVTHNVELQNRDTIDWKKYYGIRNKLLFYSKHFSKKYFMFEYIRNLKKIFLGGNSYEKKIYNKLIYTAINDAKNNVKGLHDIYKPGWKCI